MLLYSATCLFYSGVISKCSFFIIIIIIRLIYVTFFCCFFTCTHTFILFRTEIKDFYNILNVFFTHKSTTSANVPMHRSYYRDRFELTHFPFFTSIPESIIFPSVNPVKHKPHWQLLKWHRPPLFYMLWTCEPDLHWLFTPHNHQHSCFSMCI